MSLVVGSQLLSCESRVVIASWSCPPKAESSLIGTAGAPAAGPNNAGASGVGGSGEALEPTEFPWSTGFESKFCDYEDAGGFCFAPGSPVMRIVTDPVHSGLYAAEYTVDSDRGHRSTQARCVRRGAFPTEAYYSAWYFIPTLPNRVGVWNLFHFQGGNMTGEPFHDLWDVSLLKKANGDLRLEFYTFGRSSLPDQSNAPAIPIGAWFHIQLYVKRAADNTGAFVLYQDGTPVLQKVGVASDDSKVGQWYVGNFAEDLDPVESTVYVDDVTISATL